MALRVPAAEIAIESIGRGYDISADLRLKYCKGDSRLIEVDQIHRRQIILPGGTVISNVSKSIKCDKGDRTRFSSDVLSFQQMSEQFNQEISLTGKIPSGLFNAMFDFSGSWQKDASSTKSVAFDGVFITLYTVALDKSQTVLHDRVKTAVPSTWDPSALAKFIETFGTHIIVGLRMGGRDVVYMKQNHSSTLQPADLQNRLKDIADQRFLDAAPKDNNVEIREHQLRFAETNPSSSYSHKEDIVTNCKRRGGSDARNLSHKEWLQSVQSEPDVISMSFIPITSLLNGVPGSGFLSHAINLYLRYKPPIEELHQFLEFQLPRQWAPVFSELPLGRQRKQQSNSSLQFSFMGPKLYVNMIPVEAGKRPVTGMRLYLEGKRSNRLAIHLQHLSSVPKSLQLEEERNGSEKLQRCDRRYYEKVQWKNFSQVCTTPVESDEETSVVTGAQLQVEKYGMKNILFLKLRFSAVQGATVVKQAEWAGSQASAAKSGLISTLISHHFSQRPPVRPADVNINSAVYPGGPPLPLHPPKLLKLVDAAELTRGPQDSPGYWVVSGARLVVDKAKISLRVKFSLLTVVLPDEDDL